MIGDFNQDGHPDLATGMDSSVDVLLGMGGCQLQPMTEYPLTDVVQAPCERRHEWGWASRSRGRDERWHDLRVLLGAPDGTFQVVPFSVGGTQGGLGSLMVGDVTGDGKADIVFVPVVESSPGAAVGTPETLENTCP